MSNYDVLYERIRRDHVAQDVDGQWYFHSAGGGLWSAYHLGIAVDVLRDQNGTPPGVTE